MVGLVGSTLRIVAEGGRGMGATLDLTRMAAIVDLGTEEVREFPPRAEPLLTPLLEVLQAVNRIRIEYGADPIYELPKAEPAWKPASTCVLQRALADLGVAVVDYDRAYGKGITIEHGLADFIRDFDAGKYPELLERTSYKRAGHKPSSPWRPPEPILCSAPLFHAKRYCTGQNGPRPTSTETVPQVAR
jgi:hypothetical protein